MHILLFITCLIFQTVLSLITTASIFSSVKWITSLKANGKVTPYSLTTIMDMMEFHGVKETLCVTFAKKSTNLHKLLVVTWMFTEGTELDWDSLHPLLISTQTQTLTLVFHHNRRGCSAYPTRPSILLFSLFLHNLQS